MYDIYTGIEWKFQRINNQTRIKKTGNSIP